MFWDDYVLPAIIIGGVGFIISLIIARLSLSFIFSQSDCQKAKTEYLRGIVKSLNNE